MNQQNRPQKQMQDQMRAQREQQMKQAAYLDQRERQQTNADPTAYSPRRVDSTPSTRPGAGRKALTFVLIVPWLIALCGGIGYAIGKSMLDSETGVIGAVLGVVGAFVVAGVITAMVARR